MKLNKTVHKYWYLIPLAFGVLVSLLLVGYFLFLVLIPETSPHPIVLNQSSIVNVQDGKYKKYTNNYFKYTFEYPSEYSVVENLPDFRDDYNRQTYLHHNNVYHQENTKFISGSAISFVFYTDRTMDQELESIKKGNNNEVIFTNSTFQGLKSVEIRFNKYPQIRRIFIPKPNGFLSIDFNYGPKTSNEWVKQYNEDFQTIISSFRFLDQ